MDAFTAIFSTISSSAAQTSEAPRNEEAAGTGVYGVGCVVA
ncbi:uncharacterized protein IL334_002005 [Kwoniella shivajii]|uniref:Uncharacterized protein n=1 Tax=Kwoniella shivajii TaxID=564305 RepID=A0ABZ1CTH9_9TREE|nr:hypothetical protein IL334_002005 [Kwoniella shivajii]